MIKMVPPYFVPVKLREEGQIGPMSTRASDAWEVLDRSSAKSLMSKCAVTAFSGDLSTDVEKGIAKRNRMGK